MGTKVETVFFILGHGKDMGTLAPKVHKRFTRGAQKVYC